MSVLAYIGPGVGGSAIALRPWILLGAIALAAFAAMGVVALLGLLDERRARSARNERR